MFDYPIPPAPISWKSTLFTLGRWGEAQAHAYLAEIDRAIERAAEVPGMNPLRRIGRESYRVARVGQHFVIYVEEPGAIGAARVLHGSRDIEGIFRTQEL